jgi:hypothetical protein
VFIDEEAQPDAKWTMMDKKLLMSWKIMEHETCGSCGQPLWICRSDSNNLSFAVRTKTCYAKAAMDKWEESPAGKKTLEKPGITPYIEPTRYDESIPLPTRLDWYKQLEEE